jgi:hypothetical protein
VAFLSHRRVAPFAATFGLLLCLGGNDACAASARSSAEPIAIAAVIPHGRDLVPARSLGPSCHWRSTLSRQIVRAADGREVATLDELATMPGTTLTIEVTQLQVGAGGRWSSKGSWILLHGELRRDGQRIDSFDFRRGWLKGWSGCGTAERIGVMLAADIAGWLSTRTASLPTPSTETE